MLEIALWTLEMTVDWVRVQGNLENSQFSENVECLMGGYLGKDAGERPRPTPPLSAVFCIGLSSARRWPEGGPEPRALASPCALSATPLCCVPSSFLVLAKKSSHSSVSKHLNFLSYCTPSFPVKRELDWWCWCWCWWSWWVFRREQLRSSHILPLGWQQEVRPWGEQGFI